MPLARGDEQFTTNIDFMAAKRNPDSDDPAFETTKTYTLFDESLRADILAVNADTLGIALESFFGVSLLSLLKLQVGATVAGNTNVSFGYFRSAGRLDISYPASANLNVQTAPAGNYVLSGQSYSIDGSFLPASFKAEWGNIS